MTTHIAAALASKSALLTGRLLGGLLILCAFLNGAIKLLPWPAVADMMDRLGYSSDTPARSIAAVTIMCTALYSVPPNSIVGAILWTGYFGSAVVSQLQIGSEQLARLCSALLWGC